MLLEVRDLHVRYGRVHAVKGVSINLAPGNIVAVLGANGAGKSSMLRALLGVEKISEGRVIFDGNDITHWTPSRRVSGGLVLVPEGRRIVMSLTVHENLLMGAFNRRQTATIGREIDDIYDRSKCWSDLRQDAGAPVAAAGPHEKTLRRSVGRLLHECRGGGRRTGAPSPAR